MPPAVLPGQRTRGVIKEVKLMMIEEMRPL